ncbi:MAG: hypothetical protein JXB62_23510 [Pirellulales bacterium]|nr:hypothetical protein [Pirellulales bacterium]
MVFGRNKGWIGIDFGTRALKLVQTERVGAGLRIAASAVLRRSDVSVPQTPQGALKSQWPASRLKAALSLDVAFCGCKAACTLPMSVTDLHALTVPPGSDDDRRAVVAHELSMVFRKDPQPREFDFWETDTAAPVNVSTTANVNVLSIPRSVVSELTAGLRTAGLRCEAIDGLPFVLARAVHLAYGPGPREPVAAVDWGFTSSTFCVIADERPQFTRHLRNCGFDSVVKAVGGALALSEEEAVQVLAKHGLPHSDRTGGEIQEVIAEVAAGGLHEMAEELKKTVSYLRMQYPAIVPRRLCLLGDGAGMQHVTAFLADKVGLPVDTWRLPPPSDDHREPDRDGAREPSAVLGTAVALSALAWAS